MPTFVQFGGGNIGRSFVGKLFATNYFNTVFVDIAPDLVRLLNERNGYSVVVKRNNQPDEYILVSGVRAVSGNDHVAVAREVANADYLATSVGMVALPHIFPRIAEGLIQRRKNQPDRPLDIIIAENIHGAAAKFETELRRLLPEDYPFSQLVGLVETSIGKMVPIMQKEDIAEDPLQVFSEAYDELIVGKQGFKNTIPTIRGLVPVENIAAYVDRKLFIHNMGHAATAWFGYQKEPSVTFLWQALELPGIRDATHEAMKEAGQALLAAYPDVFDAQSIHYHIEDLLDRFSNKALGDTVYRVGRDLRRKLAKDDRIVGAMFLANRYGCSFERIASVYTAALSFEAHDGEGNRMPPDQSLIELYKHKGLETVLSEISLLDRNEAADQNIIGAILKN